MRNEVLRPFFNPKLQKLHEERLRAKENNHYHLMILEWKVPLLGLSVCALRTQRSQKQTGWGLVTKPGASRIRVQIPTLWVSAKWRLWFLQLACGCGWTRCDLQEYSIAIMVTVSIFWMETWSEQRSCFLISRVKNNYMEKKPSSLG